jgi:hypothetical protein
MSKIGVGEASLVTECYIWQNEKTVTLSAPTIGEAVQIFRSNCQVTSVKGVFFCCRLNSHIRQTLISTHRLRHQRFLG